MNTTASKISHIFLPDVPLFWAQSSRQHDKRRQQPLTTINDQALRREQFYAKYVERMQEAVDEFGNWQLPGAPGNFREKLWHCLPLFYAGGEHAERANRIILALEMQHCHFSPMTAMQIVLKHSDRLCPEAQTKLLDYVRGSLAGAAETRIRFPMYNDNFAALATFTLLTAGEWLDLPEAFQAGAAKLNQLVDVFTRRGTVMEFGSPTYTPITTHVLAEIVNYVNNKEIKHLASLCESRMWAEIAARYHPPTGQFAGPYSRAYLVDSVGHPHNVHGLLHLAFGDIPADPAETLFPEREKQVAHVGVETLMLPNLAWLYSGDVHCPEAVAKLLLGKSYPFDSVTTTECLPGAEVLYAEEAEEYPAWSGPNTVHMTEDYALGTSIGQFFDGAISDSFHAVYRTRVPIRDWTDTRAVFCRYFFNDRTPGNENRYNGQPSGPEMLRDEGRKHAVQHGSCALVAYRPKPYEAKRTTSMKLSILFPVHFREVDAVWFGDRPADVTGDASSEPVPVFVKDGPALFCFRPLALTDAGREAAVKLERSGDYLMISFYNYQGPERSFTPQEAMLMTNGFVVHMGSIDQPGGFDGFRERAAAGIVEDETTHQLKTATRRIRYLHPDVALDFAYSPVSEGILHATVNGLPQPAPRFFASNFDGNALPFCEPPSKKDNRQQESAWQGSLSPGKVNNINFS